MRKVFTLQTIPTWEEDDRFAQVAKESSFSLHAGVAAQAWEQQKLERLCRYISRPAVSEKRLSLAPKPRVNLTRFHGGFAPNSKHRVDVTPAKRGKGRARNENEDKTSEQSYQSMTWAQSLKRVFSIPQGTLS